MLDVTRHAASIWDTRCGKVHYLITEASQRPVPLLNILSGYTESKETDSYSLLWKRYYDGCKVLNNLSVKAPNREIFLIKIVHYSSFSRTDWPDLGDEPVEWIYKEDKFETCQNMSSMQ